MNAFNQLFNTLKIEATVFHNGQYCGMWAVDTSGTQKMNFHVVSHGQCYLEINDHTLILETGDAVFFPSDAKHRLSNVKRNQVAINESCSLPMTHLIEGDATGLVCGYFEHQNPIFDRLLKQLPNWIVVRNEQDSISSNVIKMIIAESRSSGQGINILLNKLSDCLLYILLRGHLDMQAGLFLALSHPKLGKALEYIHDNTDKRLTLDELAMQVGMSRSAFSSSFKEVVGQSPIEYITQWRMTQAYRWLADEGISTFDAALRCGYESEASFSKAFKRIMNVGPGQVRAK